MSNRRDPLQAEYKIRGARSGRAGSADVVPKPAAWEPRKKKWNWRAYLTDDERKIIAASDEAKAKWQALNKERLFIVNRAINRCKYRERGEA